MSISSDLIAFGNAIAKDEEKLAKGNASAAVRVRSALIGVKMFCDAKRKEIQEAKNAAK